MFNRVGLRMGLKDLPTGYNEWMIMQQEHLQNDLAKSHYTVDLFKQYRKHLGRTRYMILIESQKLVVPGHVRQLLNLGKISWLSPVIAIYKFSRIIKLDKFFRSLVMPGAYKKQIKELDMNEPGSK